MGSPTPNLDLVKAWLAGDGTPWPTRRWRDPAEWSDVVVRRGVTITRCASGAPAELPRRPVVINGKLIPPPPRRQPAWTP